MEPGPRQAIDKGCAGNGAAFLFEKKTVMQTACMG